MTIVKNTPVSGKHFNLNIANDLSKKTIKWADDTKIEKIWP